jgi:hypothetical protein
MGNEDAVYLAKLAEQAERYEGTSSILECQNNTLSDVLTLSVSQRWSRT